MNKKPLVCKRNVCWISNIRDQFFLSFFSSSKFLLFFTLFIFSILLALRLDGTITWSYWAVFTPVWIWKIMVLSGAFTGIYIWIRHPEYR